MRSPLQFIKRAPPVRRRNVAGWLRNERGSAAVEFAIVAIPFFLFFLGIIGMGLYFYTDSALEHGVSAAARKIRTGQAQKDALTVGGFRQLACDTAGSYINCKKLSVLIQHAPTWSGITPQPCVGNDNNLTPSTGDSDDEIIDYTGEANEVVLVTLCYEWDLAETFGFLKLGKNSDGSGPAVVQAATAFRTEPYS